MSRTPPVTALRRNGTLGTRAAMEGPEWLNLTQWWLAAKADAQWGWVESR